MKKILRKKKESKITEYMIILRTYHEYVVCSFLFSKMLCIYELSIYELSIYALLMELKSSLLLLNFTKKWHGNIEI